MRGLGFAAEEQMGSLLQRSVNAPGVRIFKYEASIYSIFKRWRQQFVSGKCPEVMCRLGHIYSQGNLEYQGLPGYNPPNFPP